MRQTHRTTDLFGAPESKLHWRATKALLLYFKAMKLITALPAKEKRIVLPTFEHGFYWGHSENILLAMLARV